MKIAISSEKLPKVNAVKNYFKEIWVEAEFLTKKIQPDISEMPLSLEETNLWAKLRAEMVLEAFPEADFWVGMEWWTYIMEEEAYLFWSVCVISKTWEKYFWLWPSLVMPKSIKKALYEEWKDLWLVIDELVWEENTRNKNWAYGIFTWDLLTREKAFDIAIICAFSPFFNKYYK